MFQIRCLHMWLVVIHFNMSPILTVSYTGAGFWCDTLFFVYMMICVVHIYSLVPHF